MIYHEFFVDDHLANDGVYDRFIELKHVRKNVETQWVVNAAVREEVST